MVKGGPRPPPAPGDHPGAQPRIGWAFIYGKFRGDKNDQKSTKNDQNRPQSTKIDQKRSQDSTLVAFTVPLSGGRFDRAPPGGQVEGVHGQGVGVKIQYVLLPQSSVHGPPCQPFVRHRFCSWKQRCPQRSHTPPRTFDHPRNQFLPHTEAHTTVLQGAVNFFSVGWVPSGLQHHQGFCMGVPGRPMCSNRRRRRRRRRKEEEVLEDLPGPWR